MSKGTYRYKVILLDEKPGWKTHYSSSKTLAKKMANHLTSKGGRYRIIKLNKPKRF